ncbi:DUF4097 domain-containing protein [Acidaminobacter sp. JC074]|uniref:DUF4097 family beta strand repeat-containing protein n=1 Tax=Acidaminobacter sp. JC074 TaxID=2530199 RepID=UPI001F0F036F|nr:DUF4097 family beta strand repeat-containing protein [Acidaminobacter sp. JC074]MCH4889138.1 DUF4097 domain-containing protein [Acidaminobacter sp. JC074]
MKRLFLLGLIAWVFLSGCSVDFNLGSLGSNEAIRFSGYDEFKKMEEELDSDYFAVDKSIEVKEKDVDALLFGTVSGDIEIVYENRKTVLIHYYGFFSDKDKEPEYKISEKGDVKFEVTWNNLRGPHHTEMMVYLPNDMDVSMTGDSVSGDIRSDKLLSEELKMNTVSGDIKLATVMAEKVTFESVSGKIHIEELEGEDLKAETVSGDVTIYSDLETCRIDTTSGDINLEVKEQKGDLNIDTVSGDVSLASKKYNASIDLDSVSGDIQVQVNMDVVTKKDHSLTGKIESGKYAINIETVSGDIELK